MSRSLFFLVMATTLLAGCGRQTSPVDASLQRLQSSDTETRYAAMREIQTSTDPRVAEACLPLLQMEGNSIRRLAARAIGSRWQQIPPERVPVFTAALKAQLSSEHDGLVNMARRGIALLNRDYRDSMVSQSKSKRWVIYERYGLPCLIDTTNNTEELLGFGSDANLSAAWGNSEVAPTAVWHPEKDMVALDIIENRKLSTVWVWIHRRGLKQFSEGEIVRALGHKEEEIVGSYGFYTQIKGWSGDSLDFSLDYSVQKGEDSVEHEAGLRWDSAQDKLKVLSDKIMQ